MKVLGDLICAKDSRFEFYSEKEKMWECEREGMGT